MFEFRKLRTNTFHENFDVKPECFRHVGQAKEQHEILKAEIQDQRPYAFLGERANTKRLTATD